MGDGNWAWAFPEFGGGWLWGGHKKSTGGQKVILPGPEAVRRREEEAARRLEGRDKRKRNPALSIKGSSGLRIPEK